MKKFVVLCTMIVALGFVATGCGGSKKATPPPAPTPSQEVEAPGTTEEAPKADAE